MEYQHLPVVKVLLNYGAQFNPDILRRDYFNKCALQRVLQTRRMPLIRLIVAAGDRMEPESLTGTIIHNLYIPYTAPEEEKKDLLILLTQAGMKLDFESILPTLRDYQEHLHQPVEVPASLEKYLNGKLYRLNLQDLSRIVIRQTLVERSPSKSILPAKEKLPGPQKLKDFLAFNCLSAQSF